MDDILKESLDLMPGRARSNWRVPKKEELSEEIAGAPGAFANSDAKPTTLDAMKADLLDRVRNPRWEYPSWALPKVQLDEEGRSKSIKRVIDGVAVDADVYTDGSGVSVTMTVPLKAETFKVVGSAGDVRKDVKLQIIGGNRGLKRGVRNAVFKKAEAAFGKLIKDQSPEWLKMNKEMYEFKEFSGFRLDEESLSASERKVLSFIARTGPVGATAIQFKGRDKELERLKSLRFIRYDLGVDGYAVTERGRDALA